MKSLVGTVFNRAPAKPPIPYVSSARSGMALGRSLFGRGSSTGQLRAMGSNGTLFSIVNRTSTSTATPEWRLYRTPKDDGRRKYAAGESVDTRVRVTRHAALDLWNKPNDFFTRMLFIETFQQHIDLTGEGWWVIARDPRATIPLELWPVRPDRMEPVPSTEDYLQGYIYTGPSGEQVPLGLDEVIQIRMPNPEDPYRGMGPVQAILNDIDAARYSAEWNRNFFLNSAQPGGIIQVDKRLSDPEWEEMVSRWREQHQGVAQAHRVAILEQGKYIETKYTMQDMQFAQLRTVSRDTIREAFGMPKFALGDIDDVNRATADAATAWFAEQLTEPRLVRIREALNCFLLPLYGPTGEGVEFDFVSPVPADRATDAMELTARSEAAATLVTAGFDPKAVLVTVGLPEMKHTAPPKPQPVPPSQVQPALPPGADDAPEPPEARALTFHDVTRNLRRPRALTAGPSGDDADQEDDRDQLEAVREQALAALAALTAAWDTQVMPGQISALGDAVRVAVEADDVTALANLTTDADDGSALLRTALADMADQAAEEMAREAAAQGVTVQAATVDEALRNQVPRLVAFGGELAEIAAAVSLMLAADLGGSAGREALRLYTPGASAQSIADQVVAFLESMKGWIRRDKLAAALHRAQNLGRIATLRAAPEAEYRATEVHDGDTCAPCAAEDGTVFPDLDAAEATYGAGGYRACLGGDRCRGTIEATWEQGDGG